MKKMDLMKFIVYFDWLSLEEVVWKLERMEKIKIKDINEREWVMNWLKRKNIILWRIFDEGSLNFMIVYMFCLYMY